MDPTEDSDAAIIERSLASPEGFAGIFDRHAAHIQRYLARRLGREVADDLVAETFLVAFGKRATYGTGRPDTRPWLYGIATNLVGRHRRAAVREYQLRSTTGPRPGLDGHADRAAARVTAQSLQGAPAVAFGRVGSRGP